METIFENRLNIREINQIEWVELISNDEVAVIIDTRTSKEWAEGIIENAILMNVLDLDTFCSEAAIVDEICLII
ncbi:rhodanese-like domain-containing protein [Croceibacter atlanticus]|uniref:rhodanese-like domain-containing protein n=1 Tax=Croceibacter atlanticus TaxID=313588 RepID=UPI0024913FB9|nr:rhodanese-like domain-containing protein [Croceibacter atlanticus]